MTFSSSLITVALISIGDGGMNTDSIIVNKDTKVPMHYVEIKQSPLDIEYEKLNDELFSYKLLKNNWDGYNGIKPSDDIVNTAKLFLSTLKTNKTIHPHIMLSGNGEISLFWKNKKNYIEVSFDEKNKLSFFYELDKAVYGEDDIEISQTIPKILAYSIKNMIEKSSSSHQNFLINNITFPKFNSEFIAV